MSLRLLYTTDLHGSKPRYNAILDTAIEQKIKLIHLGADLLPKNFNLMESQKNFIKNFLKDFYKRASDLGITILASFGNDDLYPLKNEFRKYGNLLDENPVTIDGYHFIAYNYVPNYPFRLKTSCKNDYPGWVLKDKQFKAPIDFSDDKQYIIRDIDSYFEKKGTIQEDLEKIKANNLTVAAVHCPPNNLKLDVCGIFYPFTEKGVWFRDKEVGSQAIYDWAEREQPLLMLCGHIHESRLVTNVWKNKIKNTFVIQPGLEDSKAVIANIFLNSPKVRSSLLLKDLKYG